MKKTLIAIVFLCTIQVVSADLRYNFNYSIQGDIRGKFLLIIPYRVFFEVSGSVDLFAKKNNLDGYEFYFQKVSKPGYLIRSLGFRGKNFVIIAADYELDSTLVFMVNKIADFMKYHPSYSGSIKEFRKLLVSIPPGQQNSVRFNRHRNGIHEKCTFNLVVHPTYNEKKVDIFFNTYRIMMEFLKAYNHTYLPVSKIEDLDFKRVWQSPPLDFSENLNGVAWQVAAIIKKYVKFKQKKPFRLLYKVTGSDHSVVEIHGEARPDVKVWGRFLIRDFFRKIKLRMSDQNLIEDMLYLEIRDKNGVGGFAKATLKLLE